MSSWQPIETAPKDGIRFLGWDKLNQEVSLCFFSQSNDPFFNGFFHVNDWVGGASLSHWMPLPVNPQPEDGWMSDAEKTEPQHKKEAAK